ncbi:unnamed protein product [Sphagnum jensenii]|uniref:Uncharacterized protein n=1 Tax=Sphagnum jensenii TaxID=128206 RepID=A0ABP1BV82_9BRYO
MAGTGGGGSGYGGGDNNEERLRKMIADHLRASELSTINTRTPEGKEKLDLKKKEEERKKLPLITLAKEGIPTELAYTGAKSTIRHIVSTNFARRVEWGTLSNAEQKRVINELKAARQLKEITEQLAKARKARESGRSDRGLKALELKLVECQSVVDEVGDPPLKFLKVAERVKLVPNTTHRLGQGGIPGLKVTFASKGENESSQGNSDEEETASTAPSATTSSGPSSFARRNAGSAGGRDKEDREEDEQPPPPPENTRKKDSRKKSKRGRKSPF